LEEVLQLQVNPQKLMIRKPKMHLKMLAKMLEEVKMFHHPHHHLKNNNKWTWVVYLIEITIICYLSLFL
jgi:hypothetical protein